MKNCKSEQAFREILKAAAGRSGSYDEVLNTDDISKTALDFLSLTMADSEYRPANIAFTAALFICAVYAAVPPVRLPYEEKRTARSLLKAFDRLAQHPDLFGEMNSLAEETRERLTRIAFPPAHRPIDAIPILMAYDLSKLFRCYLGSECRPAIDALLSATVGPHREISKILKYANEKLGNPRQM